MSHQYQESATGSGAPASKQQALNASRRHTMGWLGLGLFIAWQFYVTQIEDPLLLLLSGGIIFLSAWPAVRWAREGGGTLPAFEVFMLAATPFYALPLLSQHPATLLFDDQVLSRAGVAVVVFLTSALVAHQLVGARPLAHRLWRDSLLPDQDPRYAHLGMTLNTFFLWLVNYTDVLSLEILPALRALFFGVGIICTFVLSRQWGAGTLSLGGKLLVSSQLFLQFIILSSTLFLISAGSLLLLAIIGYVTGGRRLPVLFIIAAGLVLSILHNGKSEMRRIYWFEEVETVHVGDLPGFFGQWIGYGLDLTRERDAGVSTRILERASLFHIMCILVHQSPDLQPYLGGDSYTSIPFLLVPRFAWPNKPAPHETNQLLGIHYGFVTADTVKNVSIAFGIPAEAYANYGFFGVALIGAMLGALYRKVVGWAQGCPPLSVGGLALVLLLAWSIQAEMTLAVWVSSLFQASVAVLGLPLALKVLMGR